MENTIEQIISTRRHPVIKEKEGIYRLLKDSYAGSYKYIKGQHLVKYIRESTKAYQARIERAVYFNHVQPLVDLLVGFIFTNTPNREGFDKANFLLDKTSRGQNLNEFMMNLAGQSVMMTCGVLVDSPEFNEKDVITERDRIDNELNPYCLIYDAERIRDFSVDDKGELIWVLLDNTYINNKDPFAEAETIKKYRLWGRESFQDFKWDGDNNFIEYPVVFHNIGEVPFIFVNWRDIDQDYIDDTIFEDIALYDKSIYNFTSCLDEMIVSGTFKVLFFPCEDIEEDLPPELKSGGISDLSVIPYRGSAGKPFFDGAGLQEVSPFLAAIDMYFTEILKKVGVESAEEQSIVKTGVARRYDFEKTKSYLVSGLRQLEKVEQKIYYFTRKWQGEKNPEYPVIIYSDDFLEDDLSQKLERYLNLMQLPYQKLQTSLHKLIVKSALSTDIDRKELDNILKDIETSQVNLELSLDDDINSGEEE